MANQVVKVKRETIAACMTCPLCNKLFRDATTISECLHTFCRKCIYEKLSDEELECCPICNIDLGCVPLEKLRPDHNLQDVRSKIFPCKRRKVKTPELPSVTLPIRRKERSLSSLVVSTPRVSSQAAMTGRRTRGVARKASAFRNSSFSIEKPIKKEETLAEGHPDSSSSPDIVNKFTQNTRQSSSHGEPSEASHHKGTENGAESWESKMDLWKPLNCLVEVANRTKSFKSTSQASDAKVESTHIADRETQARKNRRKSKVEDENHVDPANLELEKPKKLRRIRRKRTNTSEELGVSPQAVLGAACANHERRFGPIWFSLVASEDQEGDAPLPQIPVSYLRIKMSSIYRTWCGFGACTSYKPNGALIVPMKGRLDGNVPVSFVQKYLMRKLNLTSETEVEIRCMGEPVGSSLQLNNLVDLWSQTSSLQRIQASIGSSAKDFVMVLSYSRKV